MRIGDERVWLIGNTEDVLAVKKLFAELSFQGVGTSQIDKNPQPIKLSVKKFTNWYKDSSGKKPLYCIVPDRAIDSIWPPRDDIDEVKYGTATNEHGNVCAGLVVHLTNRVGLYFCLSPKGEVLVDGNSFGI